MAPPLVRRGSFAALDRARRHAAAAVAKPEIHFDRFGIAADGPEVYIKFENISDDEVLAPDEHPFPRTQRAREPGNQTRVPALVPCLS